MSYIDSNPNNQMRRTKIVASLGPATDQPGVLDSIVEAGVDVVRMNFSHGRSEDHVKRAEAVRTAAEKHGRPVGIIADLQGPKIRVENFVGGSVQLTEGAEFSIDPAHDPAAGDESCVGVTYKDLPRDVKSGDLLLLDDGNITLEVKRVAGSRIVTTVQYGGELSDHKGINLRGGGLSAPSLTDKDHADIKTAGRIDADYLAMSFVKTGVEVEVGRELFRAAGGSGRIISKIERVEALENISEIIRTSDGVMIARGDLGIEIGNAELPGVQKRIIAETRLNDCLTIVATQMMQSMVDSPQPTRAEVLDVANAVLDGADSVMLSAETAVGKYPAKVIEVMDRVCLGAERHRIRTLGQQSVEARSIESIERAIAMAGMYTANNLNVAAIVALTESGNTALMMSRISSGIPIFGMTRHLGTFRRMTLFRGVYPIALDVGRSGDDNIDREIIGALKRLDMVEPGSRILLTKGDLTGITGGTNTLKIIEAD